MALGLIARIPGLFSSLWYDEVFTLQIADLPASRMFGALAADVHPPLWYMLISIWPGPARVLALIFGMASLWLAKSILDQIVPARPALIGLALMSISPFLIYYSAEARMYSLLLFFVLLGVRSALAGRWQLLGVSISLGLLTHNHMALYLPGLIFVFMVEVSFSLREVSKVALIAGAIYAPWLPIAWQQLQNVEAGYWVLPVTPGRVAYMVSQLIAGYSLTGPAILIVAGLGLALLVVGTVRAIQAGSYEIVVLAFAPVLAGVVLSVVITPALIPRVLIGVVPFLLVLIAWGGLMVHAWAGHWMTVAGIAAATITLYSLYTSPPRPNYDAAYASLGIQTGDQCYHLSAGSHILASYYLPGCHHVTWPGAPHKANGLSDVTIAMMGIERGNFSGEGWIFATLEPFTPRAEVDHLAQILSPNAQQFILLENDFVNSSAWRIAND